MITFPDLDPVAISIGPLDIRWYALAYLTGILLGWRYCLYLIGRDDTRRPNRNNIDDFVLWAVIGIVFGGRIGYVMIYYPSLYLSDPLSIFQLWQGGMSFHGGMAGVILAAFLYARYHKFPFFALTDLLAAATPIGLFFGRLANFVNAELYGRVTSMPWGVVFPDAGPVGRHPSQIYEALTEGLLLFAVLALLIRNPVIRSRPGIVSGTFLAGYGLCRFVIEFFREPDAQIGLFAGMVSMGQILCLPMILAGGAIIAYACRRKHQPA